MSLRLRVVGVATVLACLVAIPAGADTKNLFASSPAPQARPAITDPTLLTVGFSIIHVFFDNYPGFSIGIAKPYTEKVTLIGEFSYNRPHPDFAEANSLLAIVGGARYLVHLPSSPRVVPYAQLTVGLSHISDDADFFGSAFMYAPGIGAMVGVNEKIHAFGQVEWRSHKHSWKWTAGVAFPIMTNK